MPVTEQLRAAMWGLGIGTVLIVTVYLIVSNAWYRSATGDRIPESDVKPSPIGMVDEYPEGLAEAHGGPTLFFKLLVAGYVVWLVGYVAFWYMGKIAG